MVERIHIDFVFQLGDGSGNGTRADFQEILAAGKHLVFRHPKDMRRELVGNLRALRSGRQNIAARDIHLIGKRERDRLPRHRFCEIAIHGDDARHLGGAARSCHDDRIVGLDAARGDRSGEATKIKIGTVHPLHRHAERPFHQPGFDIHRFQMLQQGRSCIPGHIPAAPDHIVAIARGQRDRHQAGEIQLFRERPEIRNDAIEHVLRELDQIDLVHGQNDMANAQERRDVGMTARLGEHALARIDQDDGELGIGRPRGHVARVLLMARCVRDDEFALVRGEEAIRDIDGDALLALGFQPVNQ